jgi:hypothetical protein
MANQFYYNNAYFDGSDAVGETAEIYEPRCGASIDGNMLYLNFFLHVNGQQVKTNLGDAEYRIFNRSGALVSGLSETGLSPDAEGIYTASSVSAANLLDLNHYLVEITISYGGTDRVGMVPVGVVE